MTPEILENIINLNIDDENNILHLNDIYVGSECENLSAILASECAQKRLTVFIIKLD